MEESTPHSIESTFVDNFGMTLDQFERLDYLEQEILIKRVAKLHAKMKKLNKKSNFDINDVFTKYPIFTKTIKKKRF